MNKYILFSTFCIALLLAFFSYFSFTAYHTTKINIEDELFNQEQQLLQELSFNLQDFFDDLEFQLLFLSKSFKKIPENDSEFQQKILPLYNLQKNKITGIYIEDTLGFLKYIYPNYQKESLNKNYAYREYFQSCKNLKPYITDCVIAGGEQYTDLKYQIPSIILGVPLTTNNNVFNGVLAVDISLKYIFDRLTSILGFNSLQSFYVIDNKGKIIFTNKEITFKKDFSELIPNIRYSEIQKNKKGSVKYKKQNIEYIASYDTIKTFNLKWIILVSTPKEIINNLIFPTFLKITFLGILIIICSSLILLIIFSLNIKIKNAQLELMNRDYDIGNKIQQDFLPKNIPHILGYQIAAFNLPAKKIGGDFYDFIKIQDNLGVVIGDVSGKGISAALYMMMSKTLLWLSILNKVLPQNVIKEFNKVLNIFNSNSNHESLMYLTAIYGLLDTKKHLFSFVRAGHEAPIYYNSQERKMDFLPKQTGVILGVFDNIDVEEKEVFLNIGDFLLLYTDGLFDQKDKNGDIISDHLLLADFIQDPELPAEKIIATIKEKIQKIAIHEMRDDISLLIIKRVS